MQTYSGNSNLSATTFFTEELTGTSVYAVFATLAVSGGSGKQANLQIKKNSSTLHDNHDGSQSFGLESPDSGTFSTFIELTQGDTLSLQVTTENSPSWQIRLRLVRMLDELNPL